MKHFSISLLTLALLIFSACVGGSEASNSQSNLDRDSSTNNHPLVGYWASVQGGRRGSWEFSDDGKLKIGEGPWMRYTLTGKDSVIISADGSQDSECFYKLSKNNLSVYFDGDRTNLISDFTRSERGRD